MVKKLHVKCLGKSKNKKKTNDSNLRTEIKRKICFPLTDQQQITVGGLFILMVGGYY